MKKNLLLTMTGALLVSGVQATPTIYPKDVSLLSKLENPTNSNLVADDSDPHTVWVMPPNKAHSKVEGLHTPTTHLGFCKQMSDAQKRAALMEQEVLVQMQKRLDAENSLQLIQQKIDAAKADQARYALDNGLDLVSMLDDQIATVKEEIKELTAEKGNCQSNCQEINDQLKEKKAEEKSLQAERRIAIRDKAQAAQILAQKKAIVKAYEEELQSAQSRFDTVINKLNEIQATQLRLYSTYAKMEGARAAISFDSDWDKNIQELARLNPGFDFKQIQTKNAVIYASMVAGKNLPGEGAIMGYEIAGNNEEGRMTFPSYPANISGNVRLSLVGACPVLFPELFDVKLASGTDKMKYGLMVSYEYPSAFLLSLDVKLNYYRMYKKVVKSKSSGNFFSPSSKTSVKEYNMERDGFEVKWRQQDIGNSLTQDRKFEIETEIRNSMYAKLAAMLVPNLPNAAEMLAANPGPSGAKVLSEELGKNATCQANAYCAGASIGFNVLNAAFSSSSSESSYTNINNVELTYSWSDSDVMWKPWISSYK